MCTFALEETLVTGAYFEVIPQTLLMVYILTLNTHKICDRKKKSTLKDDTKLLKFYAFSRKEWALSHRPAGGVTKR